MDKNERETLAHYIRLLAEYKGRAGELAEAMKALQRLGETESYEYLELREFHCCSMVTYWEFALLLLENWDLKIHDRQDEAFEIEFWKECRKMSRKARSEYTKKVEDESDPQWNGGWGEDYAMMRNER
jgi:hypothetical protein